MAKHCIKFTHLVMRLNTKYPFSPILQHYSRVEWLRDSKVMHVLVYLFRYGIDRHQIQVQIPHIEQTIIMKDIQTCYW